MRAREKLNYRDLSGALLNCALILYWFEILQPFSQLCMILYSIPSLEWVQGGYMVPHLGRSIRGDQRDHVGQLLRVPHN